MKKYLKKLLNKFGLFLRPQVLTGFPISKEGKFLVGESILSRGKEDHFLGYYQELRDFYINRKNDFRYYKIEILPGKFYSINEIQIHVKSTSLIPIMFPNNFKNSIDVKTSGSQYNLSDFYGNRFYYLKSETDLEILNKKKIVIGKPISLKQNKKNAKKLVLCLFIDGFTREIFKYKPIEEIMPNTYSFFSKGMIFNNCFSTSEWSLPSLASISTGKYTVNHKLFHSSKSAQVTEHSKIISEYFKENDYLTFQVCGNWRRNPSYGYLEGFDRSIYKHSMDCNEVLTAFYEHMETFKLRDNFVWLTFMDLHHHINGQPNLSQQSKMNIDDHNYVEEKNKSVFSNLNTAKIKRYITELSRLDFYLKTLFDYILLNYKDEEYLVTLFSDHGQAYIRNETHPLEDQRTTVPLMMRGTPKDGAIVNELVENIDILPTLLHLCNIDKKEKIDGKVISIFNNSREKNYVLSESIYKGQTYKAIIRDLNNRKFYFTSKENVNDDGKVDLNYYDIKMSNSENNNEDTQFYLNIVRNHLANGLIYS